MGCATATKPKDRAALSDEVQCFLNLAVVKSVEFDIVSHGKGVNAGLENTTGSSIVDHSSDCECGEFSKRVETRSATGPPNHLPLTDQFSLDANQVEGASSGLDVSDCNLFYAGSGRELKAAQKYLGSNQVASTAVTQQQMEQENTEDYQRGVTSKASSTSLPLYSSSSSSSSSSSKFASSELSLSPSFTNLFNQNDKYVWSEGWRSFKVIKVEISAESARKSVRQVGVAHLKASCLTPKTTNATRENQATLMSLSDRREKKLRHLLTKTAVPSKYNDATSAARRALQQHVLMGHIAPRPQSGLVLVPFRVPVRVPISAYFAPVPDSATDPVPAAVPVPAPTPPATASIPQDPDPDPDTDLDLDLDRDQDQDPDLDPSLNTAPDPDQDPDPDADRDPDTDPDPDQDPDPDRDQSKPVRRIAAVIFDWPVVRR